MALKDPLPEGSPPAPWGSGGFGPTGAAADHLHRHNVLGERIRGELAGNPSNVRADLELGTRPGISRKR